jgi:hypothetical protein
MSVHDAIAWAIKVSRGEPMAGADAADRRACDSAAAIRDDGFLVWPSVGRLPKTPT